MAVELPQCVNIESRNTSVSTSVMESVSLLSTSDTTL